MREAKKIKNLISKGVTRSAEEIISLDDIEEDDEDNTKKGAEDYVDGDDERIGATADVGDDVVTAVSDRTPH